jgi:predicted membrane channel-forming protein YqfA (hemolysin III family)
VPTPDPRYGRDPNRELAELVDELRVILPGTTVLFAFLLALPFSPSFAQVDRLSHVAYFTAFVCTALALVLLVGESAYHRVRGKPYDKPRMLRTATHQAVFALGLLSVAVAAVMLLVSNIIYGLAAAVVAAAGIFVFSLAVWFGLPLLRRLRGL